MVVYRVRKQRKALALIGGCFFAFSAKCQRINSAGGAVAIRQIPTSGGGGQSIAYGTKRNLAKREKNMLTAKQEEYAKNIVEGMNQADAYRSAYDAENMSDNAIYREASLLADNPKVAQRIADLRNQLAKPTIMTAQERLEWLTMLVKTGGTYNLSSDKIRAIDIMNKMTGEYVQRIEADVKSDITINIELCDDEE